MKPLQSGIKRAEYGIGAPTVVRNFFLIGVAGSIVGAVLMKFGPGHLPNVLVSFYGAFLGIGACFVLQDLIMIWGSKVGKIRLRDKMIDSVLWRGNEQVLDVGCCHGLMLIGAAKQLTTGHALGIDIWQQKDQARNSPQATMENAQREGVADRITLRDSDARSLSVFDESFDVIASSFAIHNIYDPVGREKAIKEIHRVLKAGGQFGACVYPIHLSVRRGPTKPWLGASNTLVPKLPVHNANTRGSRRKTKDEKLKWCQSFAKSAKDLLGEKLTYVLKNRHVALNSG